MTIEGDTQHAHGGKEGDILALLVIILMSLVDGPDHAADEQDDIDNLARIERTTQCVDEEKLKPSAYLDDTRHDAIKHCCQYDDGDGEGDEGTAQVVLGIIAGKLAVVIYQHDGRQTQQVEQVDTNGQTRHIHDEHQPAVAVRLVCMVIPFHNQPEHYCGECR